MSESIRSTYRDSLDSKTVSPDEQATRKFEARIENARVQVNLPTEKNLRVSVDLNDRNNYMPVAMHPTEVVKKAREFRNLDNYEVVEESNNTSSKAHSESKFYPSP